MNWKLLSAFLVLIAIGWLFFTGRPPFDNIIDVRTYPKEAIESRYLPASIAADICNYRKLCGKLPASTEDMFNNICEACRRDEKCGFASTQYNPSRLVEDKKEISIANAGATFSVKVRSLSESGRDENSNQVEMKLSACEEPSK